MNKMFKNLKEGSVLVVNKNIAERQEDLNDARTYNGVILHDKHIERAGEKVTITHNAISGGYGVDSDGDVRVMTSEGQPIYFPIAALRHPRKSDKN